jgi:hypothetical protein
LQRHSSGPPSALPMLASNAVTSAVMACESAAQRRSPIWTCGEDGAYSAERVRRTEVARWEYSEYPIWTWKSGPSRERATDEPRRTEEGCPGADVGGVNPVPVPMWAG